MYKTIKDDVIDNYHGTKVSDPYRWLEDPFSDRTKQWVADQNKITRDFIGTSSERDKIVKLFNKLRKLETFSVPVRRRDFYFYAKNDGSQNQPVIYKQTTLNGKSIELINPNKLNEDGTTAINTWSVSDDGKYIAYAVSENGSDWQYMKVRDVETGKDLDEKIMWCKFTSPTWKKDNSGFFYTRFPEPGTVSQEDAFNYAKVYFHKIGTKQEEDELIYEDPKNKELGFSSEMTEDGKYHCLFIYHGTDSENRFYYRDINNDKEFTPLLDEADASYILIGNQDNIFYFNTNLSAPNYRIIAIDINNPERSNWKEIIKSDKDTIENAHIINNSIVTVLLHKAYNLAKIYDLDGNFKNEIQIPSLSSITGISGKQNLDEMFIQYSNYTSPSEVFRYTFSKQDLVSYFKPNTTFNKDDFESKQIFYKSKDGTEIPMIINYKKGMKLNGDNPALLYGYGGFDVNLSPAFSIRTLLWMELGGVYAIANLRGGGEFGESWHKAGMLENKQNVFDDFIAAGEWLIDNKYTSNKKLSIMGGSNGGLLVAACMVQRPDLYGAVICRVPVIDMLRYHKFTIGRFWTGEYGNAEKDPEHFKFMYAYSPLHNVKNGTEYPPTLICSADTDDRVVPAHAKKFAATLQENQGSEQKPILIRIETNAGHGLGKPINKIIDEESDIYAFLLKVFSGK